MFLGLLGTFWGLIETVGSVGKVIDGLKVGGDAGALFDTLKEGLAAPLGGMGISFSSSLFGLAGSLILGFLDLQSSQAQNRFYTDLEDWLASTVREYSGEARRRRRRRPAGRDRAAAAHAGRRRRNRGTTAAMANLAEAIQGLVAHMRTEQQMIREWADGQGEQNREIKKLLERLARQPEKSCATRTERPMALARARRNESGFNYWPGFVDALSTLVLSIVFLLSVFLVVQFFLSQEVTGKDKALEQLNAKIAAAQRPVVAGKTRQAQSRRPGLAAARRARLGGSRARPRQGPL